MTTRFVLVRHATCAQTHDVLYGRVIDAPLDAQGQQQARALARRVARLRPLLVPSSPRLRTRQTAAAIATDAGCPVQAADALDELDFGHWSGRRFEDLEADPDWQRWNRERGSSRTPAGTDIASVQARMDGHLQLLARAHPGHTLVLVTHAEVVRSALLKYLGRPAEAFLDMQVDPASFSTLRFDQGGVHVEAINERADA